MSVRSSRREVAGVRRSPRPRRKQAFDGQTLNTKTNWQLYSTILVVVIIVAVVAAVVVEIIFAVKDKDSVKDDKANEKLEKNDCDSTNEEKTGERA